MTEFNFENREFGRRRALIHAFLVNARGVRKSCLVRNISVGGALLEVEEPKLVPLHVTLLIDSDQFEADCEVKHRTAHSVGVYFKEVRIARNGRDTRFAGPKLEEKMRTIMLADIGRH